MVMQALESRYTVNADVLCDYLERKFSKGQFSVTVGSPVLLATLDYQKRD